MEDIIILIITAAVMIGGAISSANKKKKEAARKTPSRPVQDQERGFNRKSLGEILRELEEREAIPEWLPEQEPEYEPEQEYYGMGADSLEEQAMAEARLEAMTYRPASERAHAAVGSPATYSADSIAASPIDIQENVGQSVTEIESQPAANVLNDILGGEFDLKRAIIESEILKPRYEQY